MVKYTPGFGGTKPFAEVENGFINNLEDFYRHPAKYYIEPFKIAGNLYYIGDKKVCSHLIDTGDGLIVFDSGYQNGIFLQIEAIRSLGFDPHDIKYLITSHGHFDHFGGAEAFKSLYGCKNLISRVDGELLKSKPSTALMDWCPNPWALIPEYDEYIDDGDIISLGNTSIRCLLTPGHTPGVMSFFFDTSENGKTYRTGYLGGAGFLGMYKGYAKKVGLTDDMTQAFKNSLTALRKEKVDIMLGNHPSHNGTLEKRQYMLSHIGENPFINPGDWKYVLDVLEEQLETFTANGY